MDFVKILEGAAKDIENLGLKTVIDFKLSKWDGKANIQIHDKSEIEHSIYYVEVERDDEEYPFKGVLETEHAFIFVLLEGEENDWQF